MFHQQKSKEGGGDKKKNAIELEWGKGVIKKADIHFFFGKGRGKKGS